MNRITVPILIFVSCLTLGIILSIIVKKYHTLAIDETILHSFTNTPILIMDVMHYISSLASKPAIVSLLVLSVIILAFKKDFVGLIIVVISIILGNYLYKYFKELIQRERPVIEGVMAEGYSFPSGHVTMGVLMYGLILYFIFRYIKSSTVKTISLWFFILLMITIGIERLVTLEHYFTDVLAGYFLGGAILMLAITSYEFFQASKISKSSTD